MIHRINSLETNVSAQALSDRDHPNSKRAALNGAEVGKFSHMAFCARAYAAETGWSRRKEPCIGHLRKLYYCSSLGRANDGGHVHTMAHQEAAPRSDWNTRIHARPNSYRHQEVTVCYLLKQSQLRHLSGVWRVPPKHLLSALYSVRCQDCTESSNVSEWVCEWASEWATFCSDSRFCTGSDNRIKIKYTYLFGSLTLDVSLSKQR